MVVPPEDLLAILQGSTVKMVLLPVSKRPVPVCYDGGVQPGFLAALLLHSCGKWKPCLAKDFFLIRTCLLSGYLYGLYLIRDATIGLVALSAPCSLS